MNNQPRILIVEDDADISGMLADLLGLNGYEAIPAFSGTEALLRLEQGDFDLILLDIMLPGKPGDEVLREIKSGSRARIPVIAMSAIDAVSRKVEMLSNGAEDYITKPFDNDELLARIEVQLRRAKQAAPPAGPVLRQGGLCLDTQGLTASVNGQPLALTKREMLILQLLMGHPSKVFTKSNIYESVWGEEFWGDDNTVNVHISNIRHKIAALAPDTEYIQTVWGIGFKMAPPSA